jgi:DNA repair protein RecN (Recombination protein N)
LERKKEILEKSLNESAKQLTNLRKEELQNFKTMLNNYAKDLYLQKVDLKLKTIDFSFNGCDKLEIFLNDTSLNKISTGEFNRLRLAVLAVKSSLMQDAKGVLVLDEVDANLSGEESQSVAKVLKKLSSQYQIFVISHQPQLTSHGNQHFLVYKDKNGTSFVKELSKEERIDEIARIISGEKITKEALNFAKELLIYV